MLLDDNNITIFRNFSNNNKPKNQNWMERFELFQGRKFSWYFIALYVTHSCLLGFILLFIITVRII